MIDEEVEDLASLESSIARQDADAEVGAKEQSSLTKVDIDDPGAVETVQV
jgi:hypothetical protein